MNISQQANGEQNAIIHIQLTETDYAPSVEKQLSDYKRKATMPGFRPGKVPMGMIKKMYGKSVLAEEINKLISDSLNNYISENKLNILGQPLPNAEKTTTIDFDTQKEFDFYFDIAFSPEFEVELSDKIEIPYYDIKVSKTELDKAIADVKIRFGTEENPEEAEITDGLQGMFSELGEDGNIVEGGVNHKGFFRIEDVKLKTIQEKMIGAKIGDAIDFSLMKAFKDEAKVRALLHLEEGNDEKLKETYRFAVESVIRTHEAEINEELFKKVFPNDDIKTEKEFKAKIKEEIKSHFQRDADRQFLDDSINELLKITKITLPDEFMKRWLIEINQGKINKEQIDLQYDSYAKSMKWQLIEEKLHEKYGEAISVTREEIRNKVRAYFSTMGGSIDNPQVESIIDTVLQNREEEQRIFQDLQSGKLIKLFKENLKQVGKEVDQEKFFEIVSNTNNENHEQ
ncbi:MAG TPA: trigger factor [Bacteroidales bacterium]